MYHLIKVGVLLQFPEFVVENWSGKVEPRGQCENRRLYLKHHSDKVIRTMLYIAPE